MRAEPASPAEVRRALGCLGAACGGGIEGKELRGTEDVEEETEEKEGIRLQALRTTESGKCKE